MARVRRFVLGAVGMLAILMVAWLVILATYEWQGWVAHIVYAVRGPMELSLVNGTATTIPAADFGIGGAFCHVHSLKPSERATCRPRFRAETQAFFRFGNGRFEGAPVRVSWRSHGSVDLIVTDGGVEVSGGFLE